jgi:transmembrane sensor
MADIHHLPTVRNVEQEASEWIARLNADDVTPDDRARFEVWRRAHPLHSQAFEDLSVTWHRFLKAGEAAGMADAANCAIALPPVAKRRSSSLALAAAVVIATLATGVYFQRSPQLVTFHTAVGEQLTVPLSDGSFMDLNSNSVARIDYSQRQRTIHLDRGEAFFRVASDSQRPFWVTAGGGWVHALGTEFNVYMRPSSLQVTVREGVVNVGESPESLAAARPDAQSLKTWVTLSGGQQADLDSTAARKRALSSDELADAMAWRTGTLYFENRPLVDVVGELNRYSAEPLILEDDSLRVLAVGGAFQAGPKGASALAHMLEQNFDVRVRRDTSGVHLQVPSDPDR